MVLKNKEIKKLFDSMAQYFDLFSLPSVMTSFMECDDAVEGEIAAIKAELTDANRCKDIYHGNADELRKANNQIKELKEKLNNERKHGEDLADVNAQLASETTDLKARLTLFEHSRITWRARAQHAEKEVQDLNKAISDLEKQLAETKQFEERYHSSTVDLDKENDRLREVIVLAKKEINTLKKKIHELEEESIHKRPWHGDGNAMTGTRTCCKSLSDTIEFQNKKIEELEAEKARLKEAYDVHETTIKRLKLLLGKEHKEKEDLSYGHKFEFGDKVIVPWSSDPYVYIKPGELYNPRTKSCVYVGKTQHLKWFGERFEIK